MLENFEKIILFTDEILDDVICLSEPNAELYKYRFETNRIKAYTVLDYSKKVKELLEKTAEQVKPIYDYLILQEVANNGSAEK